MDQAADHNRGNRWSTNANIDRGSKTTQQLMQNAAIRNPSQHMESTNSDDGDYDVDERGVINSQRDIIVSNNNNGMDSGMGGEGMMEDVEGDNIVGMAENLVHIAAEGNTINNMGGGIIDSGRIPVDDILEGEGQEEVGPNAGEGNSDISSAEKYADRNSDPGVHVPAEADYPLPPGQISPDTMMGVANIGGSGGGTMSSGLPPNPLPHGSAAGVGAGGGDGGSVSLGTATQTHEVRMPMLLSTFKPATGCTNASDFIVRCFVARLRSGITVVKHGRSRWCKSRLRVLHVHPDGRSLSWKPALGEPSSGKRPPKLDLTSCKEVRHAWSPDPDNPMFTGTPILRQKCEAANAHKSFALIFPKRTVDITAVTADQCKVLMEGFSALCFRLQVAQNVASNSGGNQATGQQGVNKQGGEGMGSGPEDKAATASVTNTNTSLNRVDSSKKKKSKLVSFSR